MRGVSGLAIIHAPHNGRPATAIAHVRMRLVAHVRIQPPSVQNASASRAHDPLHDTTITRREHGRPRWPKSQNRRSASSMTSQPAPATVAATAQTAANMRKSWPRCRRPQSCRSHHMQPKQPNPAAECRSVHVSFSAGQQVCCSFKRRLPDVKSCIGVAFRDSARSIWLTFTGSTCGMTGFV